MCRIFSALDENPSRNSSPSLCCARLGPGVLASLRKFASTRSAADESGDFLFATAGCSNRPARLPPRRVRKFLSPAFSTDGWHATSVPSTVVAALVADKTFPDPYFGENLRSIPGTTYPIGKMFSVLPMPKDSPFRCSWWYRTEFRAPDGPEGRHVSLHFDGIN